MSDQQTRIYMEELSRQLVITMKNKLPDALVHVSELMVSEDEQFYAEMGQPVPVTTLVPPQSYMVGHHPPVLEVPLSTFPSIAAVCYRVEDEESEFDIDQIEVLPHVAYIEAIVYHEDLEMVTRIAWRYAKAVHHVLINDRSLGGKVLGVQRSPLPELSQPAQTEHENDSNRTIYVQGMKVEHPFEIIGVWQ